MAWNGAKRGKQSAAESHNTYCTLRSLITQNPPVYSQILNSLFPPYRWWPVTDDLSPSLRFYVSVLLGFVKYFIQYLSFAFIESFKQDLKS